MRDQSKVMHSTKDLEIAKLRPEILAARPLDAIESILLKNGADALIESEDADEFILLMEAVRDTFQPKDIFELLLMNDFVHAEWELRRLRRLVSAAFVANRPFAVSKFEGISADRFCDSPFVTGTYKQTLSDLAAKGQSIDNLDGLTLLMHTDAFESFDKRAAVLEMRRDTALDKFERRRSAAKTISPSTIEGDRE